MSTMLQVRNIPDEIHRTLKARAAMAGMSLSDYALRELRRVAERPTPEELKRRIAGREPVAPSVSPAVVLAEERTGR